MGVARIAVAGTLSGQEVRNVFTVECDTAITPNAAGVNTWLTALYDTSNLTTVLSTDLVLDRFYIEWLDPGSFVWTYGSEAVISLQGESNAERLPNQIAVVVVGITPSRRRAKKFIPGVISSSVDNGVLDGGITAILENFGDTWKDGFFDGDNNWITGVVRVHSADFLPITSIRVDPYVGTQRRRKPGVGQ
jgi:hypothetical protein